MDHKELTHSQLRELHRKRKEAKEQRYLEESKKRLDNIASKKMQTSFIGALDIFEKTFGFLWGMGEDRELTPDEEAMRDLWMKARTEILDNGHTQLRALSNEIANHVVSWKRYTMELPVLQRSDVR